jgi:hypothetical protein
MAEGLHLETVDEGMLSLLKRLMADKQLEDFNLVGGTALSLRLGHRKSVDLDLFRATPFSSFKDIQQLTGWTQSGLVGVTKTISLKSKYLKKTQVQLLWDFLSYSQVPQQPPVIFRVGYGF